MSKIEVDAIEPQSGTSLTLGASGDTITIPSGATITNSGTATGFGGTNTPAFEVKKTSDQSVTTGTLTQVTFDTEIFDTDNAFSSNTFTVPAGKNGKYYFYSTVHFRTSTDNVLDSSIIYIYKNGAEYKKVLFSGGDESVYGLGIDATMELAVSDTIKIYGLLNASSGTLSFYSTYTTYFGGYKLIE
jgi:hypothetical protein